MLFNVTYDQHTMYIYTDIYGCIQCIIQFVRGEGDRKVNSRGIALLPCGLKLATVGCYIPKQLINAWRTTLDYRNVRCAIVVAAQINDFG